MPDWRDAAAYEPLLEADRSLIAWEWLRRDRGYREAAAHLAGEWSLEQAIKVTARRTRQYAKRQLSWFRRDGRITWLPAGDARSDAVLGAAEGVLRGAIS